MGCWIFFLSVKTDITVFSKDKERCPAEECRIYGIAIFTTQCNFKCIIKGNFSHLMSYQNIESIGPSFKLYLILQC